METYDDTSYDIEGRHLVVGVLIFMAAQALMPAQGYRRTRGANATAFLGKDQKPVLMQLKNCQVRLDCAVQTPMADSPNRAGLAVEPKGSPGNPQ